MTPTYRPDIDGLRAVAVLSILFFHVGIESFAGGYVGVDIFFVISGFLITSIIVREIASEEFSIARFYERRARRILPALIVALLATLLVGFVLLSAEQMRDLANSAIATAFYVSNIFFYFGSGYFDGPSELKPLLHTWSLAVEEQYYILFPFLMLVIARRASRRYAHWLIPLALASFLFCVYLTSVDPSSAFYLIPTRAWQLFTGSILALRILPTDINRSLRNTIAAIGLLMMLAAIFTFDRETDFPGYAAALPTIGTAMVIHAGIGGDNVIARMLSVRPMVFIGLISYSMYLWHWPGVVYSNYFMINELTDIEKAVLIFVIFVVSVLSWRFVERPFRNRAFIANRRRLFSISAAAMVLVSVAAFALTSARTDAGGSTTIADDPGWPHWKACEDDEARIHSEKGLCRLGSDSADPEFIFWGDSHAIALASAVNLSARRNDVAGVIATRTACPPLLGIERPGRTSCDEFNRTISRYIQERPSIHSVVLTARWALSTKGTRYKEEDGRSVTLVDTLVDGSDRNNVELFEAGLRRTLEYLVDSELDVTLVGPIPEVGFDVPSSNYIARLTGRDINEEIAPTAEEFNERTREVSEVFMRIREDFPISIVSPASLLCNGDRCDVVRNSTPVYRDNNHLSIFGAQFVSPVFDDTFAAIANRRAPQDPGRR